MIRIRFRALAAFLLALSVSAAAPLRSFAETNPAETQIFVDNGTVLVYDKEESDFRENQALTETPMLEDSLNPVDPADYNGQFYPALKILSEGENGSFTVGGDVKIELVDSGCSIGIETWAEGNSAAVTVTGDVTAEAVAGRSGPEGTTNITVDGSAYAELENEKERAAANAVWAPQSSGDYFAAAIAVAGRSGSEGTTNITVDGSAYAESENEKGRATANAVWADAASPGSSTVVHVTGDAVASSKGLQEEGFDETSTHAINAIAENGGVVSVTVDGKASAVSTEPTLVAQAVFAEALNDPEFNIDGSRLDVTVGGGAEGQVYILAENNGSSAKVDIKDGGVTSVSGPDGAVFALSHAGDVQLSVVGNINAEDSGTLPGEAIGVTLVTQEEGTLSAALEGDITALVTNEAEDSSATGLLVTNESGTLEVTVIGDITASGSEENIGIDIQAAPGRKTDILVDGTVTASDAAVVLVSPETQIGENVTLTVWELVPDENGAVISRAEEGKYGKLVEDEAAEKAVQYIIRIRHGQQDIISTEGTASYKDYAVAHEGDTVTLKLNIPAGCEITGAYADEDQQVLLSKDANGNYFLTVPRGGAVELSVTMNDSQPPAVGSGLKRDSSALPAAGSGSKQDSSPLPVIKDSTGAASLEFHPDGTYSVIFTGRTESGTYGPENGTLVLVSSSGTRMAVDGNRRLIYTSVEEPEKTFEFRFTQAQLDCLLSVRYAP